MFRLSFALLLAATLLLLCIPTRASIPGYSCYRTVEETESAMAAMASAYPGLATLIDIGNSWEREEPGGMPGYDVYCLRLTNSAVAGPKPVMVVTAAVEPKDLAGAELALRFAEYLAGAYGTDADATWILDYHEVHLIVIPNPDGRKQAESGLYWYKNTNQDYCSPTSDYRGANIDRNFPFEWGCCGGSSGSPCDYIYRGPSATSEVETQAVRYYLEYVLADSRPGDLTTPAPDTTMGVVIDLKSYGGTIAWSWGFSASDAPNQAGLRTLGRKLAFLNGYVPERQVNLSPVDGTLLDFAYGELGVAAYAVHLGTDAFETCSSFENTVLPDNMDVLLAAARMARAPYLLPSGPDAVDVQVGVPQSGTVKVTATIDDTRFSTANGTEPSQNIAAAKFYIDTPPWVTSPVPVALPLWAEDGSFDSSVEDVTAILNISGLPTGKHIIFVRGQDAGGKWGAVGAALLDLPSSGVEPGGVDAEPRLELSVHPVPCLSSTSVNLRLSSSAYVTVEVIDMMGRVVRCLTQGNRRAGTHVLPWDCRDASGRRAAPGVYAVRVCAAGRTSTVKAVILK
jgi:carboxypeptidase T